MSSITPPGPTPPPPCIRCRSPACTTAGVTYDVSVQVSGVAATYARGVWRYEAPRLTTVAPAILAPLQTTPLPLNLSGANFGVVRGVVRLGPHSLACPLWSDSLLTCLPPSGVLADAPLVVVAASGATSATLLLHYRAPAVEGGSLLEHSSPDSGVGSAGPGPATPAGTQDVVSGTRGGGRLSLVGTDFGADGGGGPSPGATPFVTVWLARGGALPGPPWTNTAVPGVPEGVLQCPLVPGAVGPASLTCVVPPGFGTGWRVVVVNHDPGVGGVGVAWRASLPSGFALSYRPPVVAGVRVVGQGGAPALGGFQVVVSGTDFSAQGPQVTIGSLPCTPAPGSDTSAHEAVTCVAPPWQIDVPSVVGVTVDGQASAPWPFVYDPPRVLAVTPGTIDAVGANLQPPLALTGSNFGVRYRAGLPTNHTLLLGGLPCGAVAWVSNALLTCVPNHDFAPGVYNVTVVVAGAVSAPLPVPVTCPPGTYGRSGVDARCAACPAGAQCRGRDQEPSSLWGWYPLARAHFVPCSPSQACAGGVDAAALAAGASSGGGTGGVGGGGALGCARYYSGVRCAECTLGAYRRGGQCRACPDTAWLLLVSFCAAVVGAVAAAVYLNGKRINMAGLSVGVVRAARWWGWGGLGWAGVGWGWGVLDLSTSSHCCRLLPLCPSPHVCTLFDTLDHAPSSSPPPSPSSLCCRTSFKC